MTYIVIQMLAIGRFVPVAAALFFLGCAGRAADYKATVYHHFAETPEYLCYVRKIEDGGKRYRFSIEAKGGQSDVRRVSGTIGTGADAANTLVVYRNESGRETPVSFPNMDEQRRRQAVEAGNGCINKALETRPHSINGYSGFIENTQKQ